MNLSTGSKCFWRCVLCLIALLSGVEFALADPKGARVIDQLVTVVFQPERVFIVETPKPRKIRRHEAVFARSPELEKDELLVGAFVPPGDERESIHFAFFLAGGNGQFAATPVRIWSGDTLERNAIGYPELLAEIERLDRELVERSADLSTTEATLRQLRTRASKAAGIDEIIDLRMELARLKGTGETKVEEEQRLRELIVRAEQVAEAPDLNTRRQELSEHLREAARVSATAARLKSRRREAARTTIESKIALIKEMSTYNAEALAQEVLRLRHQRKALETKLGGAKVAEETTDF